MIVLVNFGGPRSLQEVPDFLTALLQDRDLIRTKFPNFIHNWLFRRIAIKRAKKVSHDYLSIGGKSPIYFDTEEIASQLQERLGTCVVPFHRYLPSTHKASFQAIESSADRSILVLPLFPQFSYATTGSIARLFASGLCCKTVNKLRWIKSYPMHSAFIAAYQRRIRDFIQEKQIPENEAFFLFSAHGVPKPFICTGDPYQQECEDSFEAISSAFPDAIHYLSYQSKFGRGEWIRPYTDETCESILSLCQDRKHIVMIPLTFTSDHIETLFEIEQLYLPPLRKQGLNAHRCPALNLEPYWISALAEIAESKGHTHTQMLIRNNVISWCCRC